MCSEDEEENPDEGEEDREGEINKMNLDPRKEFVPGQEPSAFTPLMT